MQRVGILQDEVRGLSETVQRLASENETLTSQSTVGAVRKVPMANEVARLNNPTAFSGAEEEYSGWEFALTCFVGTMDGTLLTELREVARVKRVPTDEAENERARTLFKILALLTTKGPRKMVREVPDQNGYEAYRSLMLRYGSRDAHGETAFLIKVMNFNFGDIDAMETEFEEFNLLIKEHDDISGIDNTPDTIKRAILWNHCEPICRKLQLARHTRNKCIASGQQKRSVAHASFVCGDVGNISARARPKRKSAERYSNCNRCYREYSAPPREGNNNDKTSMQQQQQYTRGCPYERRTLVQSPSECMRYEPLGFCPPWNTLIYSDRTLRRNQCMF